MKPEEIIAIRRDLHQHAEPGFLELRTASRILEEIEGLPINLRTGAQAISLDEIAEYPSADIQQEWRDRAIAAGAPVDVVDTLLAEGTAIVAEITGDRPGPTWGLRVDIDALPIIESDKDTHFPNQAGFRSTTPYMHACGHDGHAAIGIALLHRLADRDFPGTVRIIFQPAEEGVRGAVPMIKAGVVEGVDRMLAVHLGLDRPTGIVSGSGVDPLATTKYVLRYTGVAAHAAASPQSGRNALAAAATATLALLGMPRSSEGDTRVNVGTFHTNGAANIVPDNAEITFEIRGTTNPSHDELDRRAREICAGVAATYGVEYSLAVSGSAPSSVPDQELIHLVGQAAQKFDLEFLPSTTMPGSDDAHAFIRAVQEAGGQGTYVIVYSGNPAPHHSKDFDIEEDSILIAIDLLESVFRAG